MSKCFCHFNGYEVKDANARKRISANEEKTSVLESRMNVFSSLPEGSTAGDAELQDIRVGWDGTRFENAGTAVREITKGIARPINSIPGKIVIPDNLSDTFTVSNNNGVYHIEYTKPDNDYPSEIGLSIPLGKTQAQLIGKACVVKVISEHNMEAVKVFVSNAGHAWGGTNIVAVSGLISDGIGIIPITNDVDMGNKYTYCIVRFNSKDSFVCDVTVHLVDTEKGHNIVPFALQAGIAPIPETINFAKKAGFDNFDLSTFTQYVAKNNGTVTLNDNEFTISVVDGEADSTFTFTVVSVNITKHINSFRGIYVEADDSVDGLFLTESINSWEKVISKLERGYNDITNIDFSQFVRACFTAGVTTTITPPPDITGKVKIFFVTKENEVIATKFIGESEFAKKSDVPVYTSDIVCFGDSLTAGGGWTNTLATLSGRTVHNAGTGGENVRTITARQGADVMMVNNITIPADTTPVQIATYANPIKTAFGHNATPLLQGGGNHVNPVSIGGVLGNLAWTGSSYSDTSGKWTFTRSKAGDAVTINRPTAIVTKADREWNDPHLMIIFMGQNGGYNSNNAELVQMHRLMMAHAKAKHTVVLGLSSGNAESRGEYEAAMREAFGRYFISLREYLSAYGLADAGLTPTDADTAAMEIGQVPPKLLADGVHYTSACKTVIGNMLYKKCCELGIF